MTAGTDRLERLSGLARVWADLYFYHPALTVPDPRWERLLLDAIPRVEAAQTPAAFAGALNDILLRHLDHSWTQATVPAAAEDAPPDDEGPRTRLLAGGAGYLDARWRRDSACCGEDGARTPRRLSARTFTRFLRAAAVPAPAGDQPQRR
jgi:hypothetical protein